MKCMNQVLPEMFVTQAHRERYAADGVIWLQGVFDSEMLDLLRDGVDQCERGRSPEFRESRADGPRRWGEVDVYRRYQPFADYIVRSPLGQVAAELLSSATVRVYVDHLFVKDPGCDEITPWHQDIQYFEVEGEQICSIWAPLEPVSEETGALRFLRGSHRGPLYLATDFTSSASPLADQRDVSVAGPPPRFGEEPPGSVILCRDMEPGDCVIFHGRTVHSAFGAGAATRRAALTVRLIGDDAVWNPRPQHSTHIEVPLAKGDPVTCDRFPQVFPRNPAQATTSSGKQG